MKSMDKMSDTTEIDLFKVCVNLVNDINEMTELMKEYDENDSFVDYLEGSIATRDSVVRQLGFADYLEKNVRPY